MQPLLNKYIQFRIVCDKKRSGRPKIIDPSDERAIKRIGIAAIKNIYNFTAHKQVSTSAIQKILKKYGYRSYVAVKKPFLKLKQRMNRIRWTEEYKDWDAHKWSSVVFSDECIIQYLSCTRKIIVRRLSTEKYYTPCIQSVIRHGTKIHIWGCFSSN